MSEKPGNLASVLLARDAAPSETPHKGADVHELLFAKGAATAAGFQPRFHPTDRRPSSPSATAAEAADASASTHTPTQPFRAAMVAFGCVAILAVAGVFIASRPAVPPMPAPAPLPMRAPAKAPPPLAMMPAVPEPPPASAAAAAPAAPPIAAPPVAVSPPAAPSVSTETEELVARGTSLLVTGDIAGARLYFERAAEAGDGHAALLAGMTHDPLYLEWAGVHGMRGEPEQAETWYRRARDLGEPDAQRCIDSLVAWRSVGQRPAIDSDVTPP